MKQIPGFRTKSVGKGKKGRIFNRVLFWGASFLLPLNLVFTPFGLETEQAEAGIKSATCPGGCPKGGNEKDLGKKNLKERVFVNGKELSEESIDQLKRIYGVNPKPGPYWYDKLSGLYGVMGYPAYGFMLAGHNFGRLSQKASNGNSGVFINGRELPEGERLVWSNIVGSQIHPGWYWLDKNGNAGYEGNPIPLVNLYKAAQARNPEGTDSVGDNFWSGRFSAGNSSSDGSQGYVSVPGYGPVGYGF